MKTHTILIAGGYGTVGSVVAQILAGDEHIKLCIAGRNASKAQAMAQRIHGEWRTLDVTDRQSIASGLHEIDMVINCFSGPFTNAPLHLPELAARQGIHYLDVSESYEYTQRFLALDSLAKQNKAVLISALGANPGIPGIVCMHACRQFEEPESGTVYFVLGSNLEWLSVSSLKELQYMFDVKPLVWNGARWETPKRTGIREYVGKPFEKHVYLGMSLTRDLIPIPELTGLREFSFWSGSQNTLQGTLMVLGMKLGLVRSEKLARLFLGLLKRAGKGPRAISDALMQVEVVGKMDGEWHKRRISISCAENYATAIAPALACRQLTKGAISQYGAFLPPQVIPAHDFIERLKTFDVHYSATFEAASSRIPLREENVDKSVFLSQT